MPTIGDIVAVTGFPGVRWVVESPAASAIPPEKVWRCIAHGGPSGQTSRLVGDGDLTIIRGDIVFEPGQEVHHWGETLTVIEDRGALVRCATPERRKPIGTSPTAGGPIYLALPAGTTDVSKPALVLANLSLALEI